MKTSVFGDTFCSLLTAQSQAQGLPAGGPLPWVSSVCLSGELRLLVWEAQVSERETNLGSILAQSQTSNATLAEDLSQPPFFQLQKVETESYYLLKWLSVRLTRGNIHEVPWLGSCHAGVLNK